MLVFVYFNNNIGLIVFIERKSDIFDFNIFKILYGEFCGDFNLIIENFYSIIKIELSVEFLVKSIFFNKLDLGVFYVLEKNFLNRKEKNDE